MIRESQQRTKIVRMLESLGAFAVENRAGDGAPDICTTAGWIELKLVRVPAQEGSVVPVDLRPSQRVWHRRWATFGGVSFVLTICALGAISERVWILSPGLWSANTLGRCTYDELLDASIHYWIGTPSRGELIARLRETH